MWRRYLIKTQHLLENLISQVSELCDIKLLKYYYEPSCEKTNNLGFQPGPTQIRRYIHRNRLEA